MQSTSLTLVGQGCLFLCRRLWLAIGILLWLCADDRRLLKFRHINTALPLRQTLPGYRQWRRRRRARRGKWNFQTAMKRRQPVRSSNASPKPCHRRLAMTSSAAVNRFARHGPERSIFFLPASASLSDSATSGDFHTYATKTAEVSTGGSGGCQNEYVMSGLHAGSVTSLGGRMRKSENHRIYLEIRSHICIKPG